MEEILHHFMPDYARFVKIGYVFSWVITSIASILLMVFGYCFCFLFCKARGININELEIEEFALLCVGGDWRGKQQKRLEVQRKRWEEWKRRTGNNGHGHVHGNCGCGDDVEMGEMRRPQVR
jgi:hypothetical protein